MRWNWLETILDYSFFDDYRWWGWWWWCGNLTTISLASDDNLFEAFCLLHSIHCWSRESVCFVTIYRFSTMILIEILIKCSTHFVFFSFWFPLFSIRSQKLCFSISKRRKWFARFGNHLEWKKQEKNCQNIPARTKQRKLSDINLSNIAISFCLSKTKLFLVFKTKTLI